MNSVIESLNRWADVAAPLVATAIWQSTLLAVVIALVAARRWPPAARYWMWQLVAIKLLLVPLAIWSLPLPWLAPAAVETHRPISVEPFVIAEDALPHLGAVPAKAELPAADIGAGEMTVSRSADVVTKPAIVPLTWRGGLFALWMAAVLLQVMRLGSQQWRLGRLLKATAQGRAELSTIVADVAARMGVRPPRVMLTELEGSPFLCGIRQPTLVFPRVLAGELNAAEISPIVAHELAHLKRRDLVWGWLPEIARLIYFFHPVAHWVPSRVRLERELACDQLAMCTCGTSAAEYAATLVRVLGAASQPAELRFPAMAQLSPTPGEESSRIQSLSDAEFADSEQARDGENNPK